MARETPGRPGRRSGQSAASASALFWNPGVHGALVLTHWGPGDAIGPPYLSTCFSFIMDLARIVRQCLNGTTEGVREGRGGTQQCPSHVPLPPADSPKKQSITDGHSLSRALKMGFDPDLLLVLKLLSLIMFGLYVVFHSPQSTGYPFKFTIPNQVN